MSTTHKPPAPVASGIEIRGELDLPGVVKVHDLVRSGIAYALGRAF